MGVYNFNIADTDPLPSPWASATGWNALRVVSNECANSAGSNDSAAMRRTDSSSTRSIIEYRSGTFDGGAMLLDEDGNGYILTSYTGTTTEMYRVDGGPSFTRIDTGAPVVSYAAGDTQEIMIDGDDIVGLKNGVEIMRATDTTHRTGLSPAIFIFDGSLRVDNHDDGVAGGQNIDVGLASETDSAFTVTFSKSRAVGLTEETDSVFPVSMMRSQLANMVEETDSAFSVGKQKTRAVGLTTETDTAMVVMVNSLPESYSTDFPDTENPISQGGMFRVGDVTGFYKNPRSTPGKCFAADFVGAGLDDCLAHLINHAVPVNHRVTASVFRASSYTAGETHEIGLYLRMEIGVGVGGEFVRGIECLFDAGGAFQVVKWLGTAHDLSNFDTGISVSGAGPGQLVDGDVIAVEVVGNDYEVFKNGVSVATFTDTEFSDGNPGMGFFVRSGGTTPENFCIESWAATEAGVAASIDVGLAEETDSAFSVGRSKSRSVGLSEETDSAIVVRPLRSYAVGLSSESDTALALGRVKQISVGLPVEADGAFGVIGGQEAGGAGHRPIRLGLGLG